MLDFDQNMKLDHNAGAQENPAPKKDLNSFLNKMKKPQGIQSFGFINQGVTANELASKGIMITMKEIIRDKFLKDSSSAGTNTEAGASKEKPQVSE